MSVCDMPLGCKLQYYKQRRVLCEDTYTNRHIISVAKGAWNIPCFPIGQWVVRKHEVSILMVGRSVGEFIYTLLTSRLTTIELSERQREVRNDGVSFLMSWRFRCEENRPHICYSDRWWIGHVSVGAGRSINMIYTRNHTYGLTALFVTLFSYLEASRFASRTCEEISIPMCKGIGYNMTYMPNQLNHDTQEEAGLEVHQFWPLVEIQCSPDLQFFLCSLYTPICMKDYDAPLPACRSVCERAKAGCSPLMRQYGFTWPTRMNCNQFPDYGDSNNLCMDFNTSASTTTTAAPKPMVPAKPITHPKPKTTEKPLIFSSGKQ